MAISAFEALGNLKPAIHTADVSSKLAQNLGEAGSLDTGNQAREHAFYAELAGKTAKMRLEAQTDKEQLIRLMGLWGTDVDYLVPNALPRLPKSVFRNKYTEENTMNTKIITTTLLIALSGPVSAGGSHTGGHGHTDTLKEVMIGTSGDASMMTRTIEVSMKETDDGDMIFEPSAININ